jgi:hypothetical protein
MPTDLALPVRAQRIAGVPGGICEPVRLLPLPDGELVMLWSGDFQLPGGSLGVLGVRVLADGSLVRSPGVALSQERLASVPEGFSLAGIAGRRLWFVRDEVGSSLVPGETPSRPIQVWLALDVEGPSPLSARPSRTLRLDLQDGLSEPFSPEPTPGLGTEGLQFFGTNSGGSWSIRPARLTRDGG